MVGLFFGGGGLFVVLWGFFVLFSPPYSADHYCIWQAVLHEFVVKQAHKKVKAY